MSHPPTAARIGTAENRKPKRLREPTDARIKRILEHVPKDAAVLDVGCVQHDASMVEDRNWLHKHLWAHSADVVGVDYDADEVRTLRDIGYNVKHADAETMDLGEEFDVVVAGELIEHLSNPGAFLECVRDHLPDDGELILTTPNAWGFCYLKRTLFPGEVRCNPEHTCWYDKRTLRQQLERHGFDVEIEHVGPPTRGITDLLNRLGYEKLGSTHLLAAATPLTQ